MKRGRPFQFQLDDRRETVRYFRDQGMTPREIARKLKRRIEVIQRDLRAIEKEDREALEEELEAERKYERTLEVLRETAEEIVQGFAREREKIQKRMNREFETISRGPRRSNEQVSKRRAVVRELQYRSIKQKEIARMLNTPLRTIQGDYASLRKRPYEIWKAVELTTRQRLSVFTDEEVMEVFLGSPERQEELKARPLDGAIQYDLKWVKKGEKWID